MSIKFFDMFAGIGGFRSGLEAIGGFEYVGYCEIDKYAKQAYEAMYGTKVRTRQTIPGAFNFKLRLT